MKGYVVRKGNQHYAVIYEGSTRSPATNADAGIRRDPIGRKPTHSPIASPTTGCSPRRSSLTVGVYLTQRWLPANQARYFNHGCRRAPALR